MQYTLSCRVVMKLENIQYNSNAVYYLYLSRYAKTFEHPSRSQTLWKHSTSSHLPGTSEQTLGIPDSKGLLQLLTTLLHLKKMIIDVLLIGSPWSSTVINSKSHHLCIRAKKSPYFKFSSFFGKQMCYSVIQKQWEKNGSTSWRCNWQIVSFAFFFKNIEPMKCINMGLWLLDWIAEWFPMTSPLLLNPPQNSWGWTRQRKKEKDRRC